MKLPEVLRPRGSRYRHIQPGLDLPATFIENLKAIDSKLFLVWHPYRTLTDNVINDYAGSLDDPRTVIHEDYDQIVFGFVLTTGKNEPIPENKWHIWRLNDPLGWEHVMPLESTHGEYLNLVLKNLDLQARWHDRYGKVSYNKLMRDLEEDKRERAKSNYEYLQQCLHEENKWLLRKAADNFEYGRTAPTNPTKDTIMSIPGVGHRSRIVTPLDNKTAGIVTPED